MSKREDIQDLKDELEAQQYDIEALKDEIDDMEMRTPQWLKKYNEFIDESNDEVQIGGLTYSPSEVLKAVDETAYDTGYNDWIDEEINSKNQDLEYAEDEAEELKNKIKELEEE